MKPKQNTSLKLSATLLAGLLASSLANAQTVGTSYSYIFSPDASQTAALGGPGDFNDTLVASGYNSEAYNHLVGLDPNDDFTNSIGPEIGVQQGGVLGQNGGNNRISSGIDLGTFSFQGGTSLDGSVETITSVTLLLYVTSASITMPDPNISIYAGMHNLDLNATPLGSFTAGMDDVGEYLSIDVPLSVAFSGFTIANLIREVPQDSINFGTEDYLSEVTYQPAYRVNTVYVIPEPSVALLGGLSALCLLRRRRNA